MQIIHFGTEKIRLIKEIRELTGFGLAEAKSFAEGEPHVFKIKDREGELLVEQLRSIVEKYDGVLAVE